MHNASGMLHDSRTENGGMINEHHGVGLKTGTLLCAAKW